MLTRWLSCRERFRIRSILGLVPVEQFNHRIEYGSMWHVAEEALARGGSAEPWEAPLQAYAESLTNKFPLKREDVEKWYNACRAQFPVYVDWWARHPDVQGRIPLLQEHTFDVPYRLPSDRLVRLRGKWDSVDLLEGGLYLQENKTKGEVDEAQLRRHLASGFELQTMLYLTALWANPSPHPIRGVRYNVVRRPLSGGKGSIVQHKPSGKNPRGEAPEDFYGRLYDTIKVLQESEGCFFYRWKVEVGAHDIVRFRKDTLDPILENIVSWYEWATTGKCRPAPCNWRHPFGAVNWLDELGSSEYDAYLESGSTSGLVRATTLFPELKE